MGSPSTLYTLVGYGRSGTTLGTVNTKSEQGVWSTRKRKGRSGAGELPVRN